MCSSYDRLIISIITKMPVKNFRFSNDRKGLYFIQLCITPVYCTAWRHSTNIVNIQNIIEFRQCKVVFWNVLAWGRRGRIDMVVWFTTTSTFSAYHHYRYELESRSWRGALDTILCDKVCQWFLKSTPVSSSNKTKQL